MTQEDVEPWVKHFLHVCFGNPRFGMCFGTCIMFLTLPICFIQIENELVAP